MELLQLSEDKMNSAIDSGSEEERRVSRVIKEVELRSLGG